MYSKKAPFVYKATGFVYAASMARKTPKVSITTVRYDAEDRKIIDALKKRLGVSADSQIFRMGLRALAREQGVPR